MLQSALSNRKLYRDMSVSATVLPADNYSVTALRLITCLPGHSIFIQKVTFSVNVEDASEVRVQSSNATPVKVAEINAPSTEGAFPFDFDEAGVKVAEGEHVNFSNSAAGMGLVVFVQAYMKPTGTMVAKAAGVPATDFNATL